MDDARIRAATRSDAAACAAIYAPYVTDTAITFELDPPDAAAMAARIEEAHEWLVILDDGQVVGYAYAGPMNKRAAYRFACEVSIYLGTGRRRSGAGRALYSALFEQLAARGYRTAVAGMTLPNEASAGLHRTLGFEPVGVFRRVGWKFDTWHDVEWLQRPLDDPAAPDPPAEPG